MIEVRKLFAAGLLAFGLVSGMFGETNEEIPFQVAKGKVAVVYFSWSPAGNTRFAAETIARKLGAPVFEIKAEQPYSSDFSACCREAKPECYGKKYRPILPVQGFNPAKYDAILIGTPNWWGTMAPPIRTFIARNESKFERKAVCIFVTHGGGGLKRVGQDFAEMLPGSNVLPPYAILGKEVRSRKADLEAFAIRNITVK